MLDKHDLISKVKELELELGRTPTRNEFRKLPKVETAVEREFGTWGDFLIAAGLKKLEIKNVAQLQKAYSKLCSKREQIQGFFRSTLDLDELFRKAGNPKTLKLSAMPDTHVKHRDKAAVQCYLNFLKWYQPHVHMIMGDFPDCEGASHWPSNSREPKRLIPEMLEARKLLEEIVECTKSASTRIYIKGNHEAWIDQALAQIPEIFDGIDEIGLDITLEKLLDLDKFGYELFPLNELVQIGKAHFTHGLYTGNGHAKKHMSVFKCNVYYGHLHDGQSFNETSIYGNLEAASLGCLCRLDAPFLKGKPNNWVHGSGAFEFFPDGTFIRYQIPIFDGKTSFAGMVFDGNEPQGS